jgi:hypothetical protein
MTEAVEVALIVLSGTGITVTGQVIIARMNRGLMVAQRNESREEHEQTKTSIKDYHAEVNDKMDKLIVSERKDARREGKAEGIAEATEHEQADKDKQ